MPDEESLSDATLTNTPRTNCSIDTANGPVDPAVALARGDGHYKLAEMMNRFPSCAVFRTFGTLSALNILYYQAELCQLEGKLIKAAERDRSSADSHKREYFKCFDHLQEGITEQGKMNLADNEQWQTVLRVRQVLKDYNEAVLTQSKMKRLSSPGENSMRFIKEWLYNNGDGRHVYLTGSDRELWERTPVGDLLVLFTREYEDFISTWITEKAVYWVDKYFVKVFFRETQTQKGERWHETTKIYSRKPVKRLVSLLAISIASLVPIISILVLNALKGDKSLRLGFMALFTVIFCSLFGLFTGARKTELLAASAAFAAVQVVFISGDGCCAANV